MILGSVKKTQLVLVTARVPRKADLCYHQNFAGK